MADVQSEARLFVLAGPDLARSFPLGERTTLGRSDECDVVLRDRSISRKHAVLVHQGESWFLQDLGSTNGVSKAGKRAERIELADGDEFRLGDLPLRLRLRAEASAHDIEFDLEPAPTPRAPSKAAEERVGAVLPKVRSEDVEIEIGGPDEAGAAVSATSASQSATMFRPPFRRVERRSGFFAGEFAQQPFWLRTLLVLVLLALCAGLAYGAFRTVAMLRSES